jgi:hypothetical protein
MPSFPVGRGKLQCIAYSLEEERCRAILVRWERQGILLMPYNRDLFDFACGLLPATCSH